MRKVLILLMVMVIALGLADYAQLTDMLKIISAHENIQQQIVSLTEQVKNGAAEESALLEATKQLSEDSQAMLDAVKNAQWKTGYYKEHLFHLTTAVEALGSSLEGKSRFQ